MTIDRKWHHRDTTAQVGKTICFSVHNNSSAKAAQQSFDLLILSPIVTQPA